MSATSPVSFREHQKNVYFEPSLHLWLKLLFKLARGAAEALPHTQGSSQKWLNVQQ